MNVAIRNYSDEELIQMTDRGSDPLLSLFAERISIHIDRSQYFYELESCLDDARMEAEEALNQKETALDGVEYMLSMLKNLPGSSQVDEIIICARGLIK